MSLIPAKGTDFDLIHSHWNPNEWILLTKSLKKIGRCKLKTWNKNMLWGEKEPRMQAKFASLDPLT